MSTENPYHSPADSVWNSPTTTQGAVRLKRLGVLSCAIMLGTLYALMGLIGGVMISFISLIAPGSTAGLWSGGVPIILLPLLYGFVGLIFGAISAVLYNLIASVTGGIEMELG